MNIVFAIQNTRTLIYLYVTLHPHLVLGDLGFNLVIHFIGSVGVFTFGRECLRKS